jgi:hypothetical protein
MNALAYYLNLKNIRRLIAIVGFLEAVVLLLDIGTRQLTGQYLTSQLPRIPTFQPTQWMALFTIRQVDVLQNPWIFALFFISAGIWVLATILFMLRPSRLWLTLIVVSLLSFWYAPFGIWLSVVEIILLAAFRLIKDKE